jgi:hypothetical protein
MLGFVLTLVLIVFLTPWHWLLRGLCVLAALVVHLIILEPQVPCGDFGCGLLIGIAVLFWAFVRVICALRFALIKWQPTIGMLDVGQRWLWAVNFCVFIAVGSLGGMLMFIWLIWALAGSVAAAVH